MITEFVKEMFETSSTINKGLPRFSDFFSPVLRNDYFNYYQSGSGARVLFIFFTAIILFAFIGDKIRVRLFSTLTVLLTIFLWQVDSTITVRNTQFHLNILGFPVPQISNVLFFTLFFINTMLAFQFFRSKLKVVCSSRSLYLIDACFGALWLIFLLPFWTGEFWYL